MSRQMLEAAWRGALDRQKLEELDEPWNIACESRFHDKSEFHSGPAAFLQVGNCDYCTGFRCARRVNSYPETGMKPCPSCGATAPSDFIPLEKSS